MKTFAIIGAAGYVAKRHMEAIKAIGGDLVAVPDPHDSVGVLDQYFPEVKYFPDIVKFESHITKLNKEGGGVDYVAICSPNYLHMSHVTLAMRAGSNVICEKPLVLDPKDIDRLSNFERETGKKIYPVLQVRLHPEILRCKEILNNSDIDKHKVTFEYSTPRGPWYKYSWKGSVEKSGGLLTNIGIHLFDMVIWIFGSVEDSLILHADEQSAGGMLTLEKATVAWHLSTRTRYTETPVRWMYVGKSRISFDQISTGLHEEMYQEIINDDWYGIEDARPSIELVHKMRTRTTEPYDKRVNLTGVYGG